MIYLDNNATTMMTLEAKKAIVAWCNMGNASASYAAAKKSRLMMDELRKTIGAACDFAPCCSDTRDGPLSGNYRVIFTSGASESNVTILRWVIESCANGAVPHIVTTQVEHKSILDLLLHYAHAGVVNVSFVAPRASGHVHAADIDTACRQDTRLICVMHANNETGALNDLVSIGKVARRRGVLFHTDAVQSFGKYPPSVAKCSIDSLSLSFHKMHGPPGVGAIVVSNNMLSKLKPIALVVGTQNGGLRGGTENVPGLGASLVALEWTLSDRQAKNNKLDSLKQSMIAQISKSVPTCYYTQYMTDTRQRRPSIEVVFLSDAGVAYLPNTLLLSIVKRASPPICNIEIKKQLEAKGIIVSVGSACNTASDKASHVLRALGADEYVRKGALRVSMSDHTTEADVASFVRELITAIALTDKK